MAEDQSGTKNFQALVNLLVIACISAVMAWLVISVVVLTQTVSLMDQRTSLLGTRVSTLETQNQRFQRLMGNGTTTNNPNNPVRSATVPR